ncbi:2,4-dienoyl-CoA reductase [Gemmobacter megaterium]|uniref:2,4-dienoyl-CoA reductase n=1 Tax=Gemmobacter megaterium TaxID=1086013 RepID=A0A1N7NCY1_9RHOB|nr:NADH:flavin oxidoreductase/NADH oxidase [Gemmobacter megaterium]GGE14347.1 NADH:flavin oxidoreductase / NADH oxidase [Gemmobacter megaterium]SIS96217.1 2,4-dienoyl-CoA reductase [Gemmobacter megaterium]
MAPLLTSPATLRGLTLRNRIVISPMCQYSATPDGYPTDWHLVQYGRFAVGGAGLVFVEATCITPEGRGTPGDLGLWEDGHIAPLARIVDFVKSQGAAAGIQLGHAGRKGATRRPWHGSTPLDANDLAERAEAQWTVIGPSAVAMADGWPVPQEMSLADIAQLKDDYASAARRALAAGFDVVELHAAHGYLIHEFLSPVSNIRTDAYGGDRAGRMRLPLEIAEILRDIWPDDRPVFVRVSAVDHMDEGIQLEDTIAFARALKEVGVDVIDCSSGGISGGATAARIPRGPGFQVPFAEAMRHEAGIASMAVGLITTPDLAETILQEGRADLIAIGREALENPNWPLHARRALGEDGFDQWPEQHGWWLERRVASLRASGA